MSKSMWAGAKSQFLTLWLMYVLLLYWLSCACDQVVTNCSFWVLLTVWGTAAGMFNALLTLLAQVICPHGYSDVSSD